MLQYIVLCCVILCDIVLYYVMLNHIKLHYITLYHIISYHITSQFINIINNIMIIMIIMIIIRSIITIIRCLALRIAALALVLVLASTLCMHTTFSLSLLFVYCVMYAHNMWWYRNETEYDPRSKVQFGTRPRSTSFNVE